MKKIMAMVLVVLSIMAISSVALAERDNIGGIGSTSTQMPGR
ncbi:MAG TPA: hypothetical protein VK464_24280 [Symbiobacteriaceae bacterium]|nr:hypothetical protein [Symbiobacteriaceae bacterium]